LAAGLAWFILKSPSPFVNKEQPVAERPMTEVGKPAKAPVVAAKPADQSVPASGVGDGKPRFEFYKVLTDKQDATVAAPNKAADKPQAVPAPAAKEIYYLQAASFSNADDAEKMKAKLTLLGMEVKVLTVTIPDKGVWYRVRVGPYKGTEEMNSARSTLKLNGVDGTPMRGQ